VQVETALALGATPREATLHQVRRSLGIALARVIDNPKTVGLIALPGAMTGLITGAAPLEAIQLQSADRREEHGHGCPHRQQQHLLLYLLDLLHQGLPA